MTSSQVRQGSAAEVAGPVGLSDVDRAVLALERRPWPLRGAKEQAIHDQFGWSPARFYQRLNAILDDPAAVQADPAFVWTLIRRRERSRRLRSGSPSADDGVSRAEP